MKFENIELSESEAKLSALAKKYGLSDTVMIKIIVDLTRNYSDYLVKYENDKSAYDYQVLRIIEGYLETTSSAGLQIEA